MELREENVGQTMKMIYIHCVWLTFLFPCQEIFL